MVDAPRAVNGSAVDALSGLCPGWCTERTEGRLVARRLEALVVKVIEDAFPEVRTVYFGNATRRWSALYGRQGVDERWLEADTPQQLCEAIMESVPRPLRRLPRSTCQASSVRTGEQAIRQRYDPAPVHRVVAVPVPGFAQSPHPLPSRLRRVLDGCRRFFLAEAGDDWCAARDDGSWAPAAGGLGGR